MNEYSKKFQEEWAKAGGLINKKTAANILGVNKSTITNRKDITIHEVEEDKFVSYAEISNRKDIKPRKKRKKKNTS